MSYVIVREMTGSETAIETSAKKLELMKKLEHKFPRGYDSEQELEYARDQDSFTTPLTSVDILERLDCIGYKVIAMSGRGYECVWTCRK